MPDQVTLHGYRYSVYARIVRMVLAEKGVAYSYVEVDPFATDLPTAHFDLHPFGRVPVLTHNGFSLYETTAITRYVDAAFDGPELTPADPGAIGRMAQVIAIADNYGYVPMIRQVFAHRVFRIFEGAAADETEVSAGLEESHKVLKSLDNIASGGSALDAQTPSLADFHLAAMIDYFTRAHEGSAALTEYAALSRWWEYAAKLPSLSATDSGIPRAER